MRSLYTTFDSAQGKDPQMGIGGMIRAKFLDMPSVCASLRDMLSLAEVDLLSIPPFSKKVKGWTIRQVPAPGKDPSAQSHSDD